MVNELPNQNNNYFNILIKCINTFEKYDNSNFAPGQITAMLNLNLHFAPPGNSHVEFQQ